MKGLNSSSKPLALMTDVRTATDKSLHLQARAVKARMPLSLENRAGWVPGVHDKGSCLAL
jgi:hypothetical protein